MATLSRIAVHPIKALDPTELERVSISEVGGLATDRAYAIVDEDGKYVNGKRTADVHPIQAAYDLDADRVELSVRETAESSTFHLDRDRDALEGWLSSYLGYPVELETGPGGALTDSAVISGSTKGPSIISEATVEEVASWFDGIDPAEVLERFRPNLVVSDVPAFWEDRLVADGASRIQIGDAAVEVIRPLPRCVVPTRDPGTGEVYDGFRETFLRQREAKLPDSMDAADFDGNLYKLMAGTRIPESEREGELAVGENVRVLESPVES